MREYLTAFREGDSLLLVESSGSNQEYRQLWGNVESLTRYPRSSQRTWLKANGITLYLEINWVHEKGDR